MEGLKFQGHQREYQHYKCNIEHNAGYKAKHNVRDNLDLRRIEHGGRAIELSGRYNIPLDRILDFSSNTNPLGYSKKAEQLRLSDFRLNLFPDDSYSDLADVIAKRFGCSKQNILVGNGSTELIRMIAHCFIRRGTRVAIPKNTYGEYSYSAKLFGGKIAEFDLGKDPISCRNADIAFLCNPNNPTGDALSRDKILNFLKGYKGVLILDESYMEFLDDDRDYTLTKETGEASAGNHHMGNSKDGGSLIILRSLSKFYGLPGVRLGYCLGDKKIIKELNKYRISWNVNSIAAKLASVSLNDHRFIAESKEYIKRERGLFYKNFLENGLRINKSLTNFFLIKLKDSKKTAGELEKKGMLVRECSSFGLANYIRVSLRKREDNEKLQRTLKML